MKENVSVSCTSSELGKCLEITEGDALAWENTVFIQVWDNSMGFHTKIVYLKGVINYNSTPLSQKELDDFKYFMNKALESDGVNVVKCGDISITVAHQGERYGISIKDRKWMLSKDDIQLLVKFCS